MNATAIIKNVSDIFWNGGNGITGFCQRSARDQLEYCNTRGRDIGITLKFRNFGERVDFNRALILNHPLTASISKRRGYTLVTFTI